MSHNTTAYNFGFLIGEIPSGFIVMFYSIMRQWLWKKKGRERVGREKGNEGERGEREEREREREGARRVRE